MTIAPGHVIWLFGLSGAGKSTLAGALAEALRARGVAVLTLDGDQLRAGLCRGLGYSEADRAENLRRAAEVARLAADSGLGVIASFITPLETNRRLVREIIGRDRLTLVHVAASLEICHQRDIKGLYARAQQGGLAQMTGISSPFEAPGGADLTLDTGIETPALSSQKLLAHVLPRFIRA
jgi:adenylyl-sulfate kinase